MLQLKNISKTYTTGDLTQTALSDVIVNFRQSEFVAVLGESGSGKTTLLNVVGGLDRYESGDLIINEKSTKEYKDANWDAYRNHSVGFVFQSYNLIPHQTVLANVELALTLSGVPKVERRQRAKNVLEKVGLGDQLHKKPNQMSGGQMQRVAIARALVNNPDILLADEPTGALDSETSVQVIDLLKEIAQDRLIIMVTHNPEIADQYANRIIHLKDGKVINDSNPYTDEDLAADTAKKATPKQFRKREQKKLKTSMSFFTALSLSLNNLLTKKARTFLTSFAGSIGIIGIALILSLSSGFQTYINTVQADTLSSYPLAIETNALDLSALMGPQPGKSDEPTQEYADGKIYANTDMIDSVNNRTENTWENNLKDFKAYLESKKGELDSYINAIEYNYGVTLNIYAPGTSDGVTRLNPSELSRSLRNSGPMGQSSKMWDELIDNSTLLENQYDVLAGSWPQSFNEVVVIVNANNEIDEQTLIALGIKDAATVMQAIENREAYDPGQTEFSYEEILSKTFKLVLQPDYFSFDKETGAWIDNSDDENHVINLVKNGTDLKVAGIVKPSEQSVAASSGSSIGYLKTLTEYVIDQTNSREIVKQQLKSTGTDVFNNLPFEVAKTDKAIEGTPAQEETTTAPAEKTTIAANIGAYFTTPTVGSLSFNGNAPNAAVVESTTAPTTMTEEDIIAYIEANYTGEEQEKLLDFAQLFLKPTRTLSERKRLIDFFDEILADPKLDEMLAGQDFEGMGDISGQQIVNSIGLMPERTKLPMLTRIVQADSNPDQSTKPPVKPGTTDPTKPTQPGQPEQPDQPVDEPEAPEPVPTVSKSNLQENLDILGVADLSTPNSINLYPKNFQAKDTLVQFIKDYNAEMSAQGKEENAIEYTDYIGLIMSSVTKIINIVSYVLIAFVSISLVVSSIMIGIITYISVLERTKEIGILRSIGASKRDISRVFNAETVLVGFTAGILGIVSTLLLCIPLNIIIEKLADIAGVAALPLAGAIALIFISVILTTLAGLIPSRMAAKKDPVIALRTE